MHFNIFLDNGVMATSKRRILPFVLTLLIIFIIIIIIRIIIIITIIIIIIIIIIITIIIMTTIITYIIIISAVWKRKYDFQLFSIFYVRILRRSTRPNKVESRNSRPIADCPCDCQQAL